MGRFALRRLLGTRASDKQLKARFEALKELMTALIGIAGAMFAAFIHESWSFVSLVCCRAIT